MKDFGTSAPRAEYFNPSVIPFQSDGSAVPVVSFGSACGGPCCGPCCGGGPCCGAGPVSKNETD